MNLNGFIKLCNSYNINSNGYGPTIYHNNKELGLCIDIKDTTFGFLTRIFTFNNIDEAEAFLKKYNWYQINHKKYPITLSLDSYNTINPNIKYKYDNKELEFNDMLKINEIIESISQNNYKASEKDLYIANIKGIANYIIELRNKKRENFEIKCKLKNEENDLKFVLLKELTTYYERKKEPIKKEVTPEYFENFSSDSLIFNTDALELDELKKLLEDLIKKAKNEELDEKNLVTLYSNIVYNYNISILNKQINFVKNKIESEKNFNLKGSKIHNIDQELKSFLNSSKTPIKIEEFIKENTNAIQDKYNQILNIKSAYQIISGNPLNVNISSKPKQVKTKESILNELKENYNSLDDNSKNSLVLYHSFYKNICNFIWDNNYPSIEAIKKSFDIMDLYNTIKNAIYDANNSHYLVHYFKIIDFKSIDTFLASIVNICKTIDNIKMNTPGTLTVFALNTNTKYKYFSTVINTLNKDINYLIQIPEDYPILFIPDKIELDENTGEMTLLNSDYIYAKGQIIESSESITLNKYRKINEQNKKERKIFTKNLEITNSIQYDLCYIEGDINE